ncbi:uncharacterized protein LOC115007386 [Cottoperca gobio]|uniref:Uncharacterized protein LOC115007386 n=1 Tax=Cottoperca gobio TaxID=56716 RepID=A0A6J2PL59_COTGO|nr:uncharacterized protein LOC115007386 [Cottoperca gobio]
MDGLHLCLIVFLVSCSHDWISGSELEVTVRAGDNITLYCDCKLSSGVYVVWYRNCSHDNQPSLVLESISWTKTKTTTIENFLNPLPRFHFVKNYSSDSYDLLISNITDSDDGLYYCGTEENKLEDEQYITSRSVYRYGNTTTRILFNSSSESSGCSVSWIMLFTPAFTILSSSISFILVYHFFQKTDKEPQILQKRFDIRAQTRLDQDEDVCFTRVVFRATDGQTHQ